MTVKAKKNKGYKFKNVAVPVDVHEMLREISTHESRSMAKHLAVMIRETHGILFPSHKH